MTSGPVVPIKMHNNTDETPCDFCEPAPYCGEVSVSIDIMALGLNVDISIYLHVAGLLSDVTGAIGGIFGGLLGGARRPTIPKQVMHHYQPVCGKSLANHPGGTNCTVTDYNECLQRCEADAIQLSVEVDGLHDCLGISLNDGIQIDNCLYFIGSEDEILDTDSDDAVDDEVSSCFVRRST